MVPVVDLIIPAFNEEANIGVLLDRLPTDIFRRVVVVDNGSTDQTTRLAREKSAIVVQQPQRGYGNACLAGLDYLRQNGPPDYVLFVDADLSDDPALLVDILDPLLEGKCQMVIGSRPRLASVGALTPVQRFGNALSCFLIRLSTGARFTDLGPMRAITWKALQTIQMRDKTWGWTVEMQYKIAAAGMPFKEIDVPYRPRHAGVSKISGSVVGSIKAGWKILTTILLLWLFWRPGT